MDHITPIRAYDALQIARKLLPQMELLQAAVGKYHGQSPKPSPDYVLNTSDSLDCLREVIDELEGIIMNDPAMLEIEADGPVNKLGWFKEEQLLWQERERLLEARALRKAAEKADSEAITARS